MTSEYAQPEPQASSAWLKGLRPYLGVMAVGNLMWEVLQLPLYAIWETGSLREQAFAAAHCAVGDLLIATATLILALIISGAGWPRNRVWPVAILTIIFGVGYTVFSEWLNVVVRASWAYSDRMPGIALFGFTIGLSPLLQWVIVPAAAFTITRWATVTRSNGGQA